PPDRRRAPAGIALRSRRDPHATAGRSPAAWAPGRETGGGSRCRTSGTGPRDVRTATALIGVLVPGVDRVKRFVARDGPRVRTFQCTSPPCQRTRRVPRCPQRLDLERAAIVFGGGGLLARELV